MKTFITFLATLLLAATFSTSALAADQECAGIDPATDDASATWTVADFSDGFIEVCGPYKDASGLIVPTDGTVLAHYEFALDGVVFTTVDLAPGDYARIDANVTAVDPSGSRTLTIDRSWVNGFPSAAVGQTGAPAQVPLESFPSPPSQL